MSGEKDAPSPNQAWSEDGIDLTALREADADDESESESESESDSAIEPEPKPTHVSTEADVVSAVENAIAQKTSADWGRDHVVVSCVGVDTPKVDPERPPTMRPSTIQKKPAAIRWT